MSKKNLSCLTLATFIVRLAGFSLLFSLLAAGITCAQAQQSAAVTGAATAPAISRDKAAENAFERDVPEPAWVDSIHTIAAVKPNAAPAPVNLRLNDVYFYVDAEASTYIHRATQVNEAALLAQIGQTEISFQPDYQRVQLHTLRIHRGTQIMDKMHDADIRFLRREPELDNGIYGGTVSAAIVVNDVRVGDTLEIAYTITGSNPVFGNRFFDAAGWDAVYPATQRRITLNAPASRRIQYRVIGSDQRNVPQARESNAGDRHLVRFEASDLAALDLEQYTPPDYQVARWIQFSEFTSWQQVSQWADNLFSVPSAHIPPLSVAGIEPGQQNLPEKVSQALQFVQNNIRYLSISLGENSHKPYPPDQVLERRYGDCKDKSLLLVSLLRQLNIEAEPVLVSTSLKKGLAQMLPSPQLFDHAIVRAVVQGTVYYLDPTRLGQTGKLERMGQVHANAQVLVVAPGTKELVGIPAPANEELLTDTRIERVTVTKMNEPVVMAVQMIMAGAEAEMMRAALTRISATQLHKFYEGNIGKRHPDAVMLGEPKISDDREANRITVELQFRIPDLIKAAQPNWNVHFQPSNLRGLFLMPDNAKRTTPLLVPRFPSIHRYQLEVNLPEDYDAHYKPSQVQVKNPAFSMIEDLAFTGHLLKVGMDLRILGDQVAAGDTPQFISDLNRTGELMQSTLTVRQTDLKSAQAGKPVLPLKQTIAERLENVVKSSSQMIADAQKTGRDASAAVCERARAQAYLGQPKPALEEIRAAGRSLTAEPAIVRCQAEVELAAADFKAAEQTFARALALGQSDGEVYLQHGVASFYLGQWTAAASDFSKAGDAFSAQPDKARARIWRALALRRAGQKAEADTAAGASDEVWPGAALAMLSGRKTPEATLRIAQTETGNAGELALAEAYFYVGEFYLLSGEKLQARLYFQHALDKGVLYAPFHLAARQEMSLNK